MYKKVFTLLLLLLPFQLLIAQKSLLKNFPEGYTPDEIGRRISYRFVTEKHALHAGKWIGYPETFYWNGSLKYAAAAKDKALIKLLQARFEHLGLPYADTQWEVPEDAKPEEKAWAEKGYSWQTRLWIDDMYMITIVQTHAYKVTNDSKYIDRAAKEMVMYLDELQRPNGLFYHAPDVPFYWGRGNGWMAAGMTELLRYLPKNHKDRPRIMEGYLTMMKSLKEYQNPEGLWNQLLDDPECWTETSGSAMFTFAFITGVKNGWLDAKEYAPAARKAWMALVNYLTEKNQVREICVGTNKKNDKQYYYDRPRRTGDFHAQGPYLWCVVALMEK